MAGTCLPSAQGGSLSVAQRTRDEQAGLGAFPALMVEGVVTRAVTKTA
jgi:hypothetical protein